MDFKRMIVALHGLPGVGKDTLADMLVARQGYSKLAFADALYKEVAEIMGVDEMYLRLRSTKEEPQDKLALFHTVHPEYRRFATQVLKEDLFTPRTSRFHMERYGTDFCRYVGDPLRWVNFAMAELRSRDTSVVFTDLRGYQDQREVSALKMYAFQAQQSLVIVGVHRDVPAPPPHEANTMLRDSAIDIHLQVVEGDIEQTYRHLAECLFMWLGPK